MMTTVQSVENNNNEKINDLFHDFSQEPLQEKLRKIGL